MNWPNSFPMTGWRCCNVNPRATHSGLETKQFFVVRIELGETTTSNDAIRTSPDLAGWIHREAIIYGRVSWEGEQDLSTTSLNSPFSGRSMLTRPMPCCSWHILESLKNTMLRVSDLHLTPHFLGNWNGKKISSRFRGCCENTLIQGLKTSPHLIVWILNP